MPLELVTPDLSALGTPMIHNAGEQQGLNILEPSRSDRDPSPEQRDKGT